MLNNENNTSFTSAPTTAGEYTLIIRPGNDFGYNDNSKSFSFTVYDPNVTPTPKPTPKPTPMPTPEQTLTPLPAPFTTNNHGEYTDIHNISSVKQTATLISASYQNGHLDNITSYEATFNANETKNILHDENTRIFVWNSLDGMKPLNIDLSAQSGTFPIRYDSASENGQDYLRNFRLLSVTKTLNGEYDILYSVETMAEGKDTIIASFNCLDSSGNVINTFSGKFKTVPYTWTAQYASAVIPGNTAEIELNK